MFQRFCVVVYIVYIHVCEWHIEMEIYYKRHQQRNKFRQPSWNAEIAAKFDFETEICQSIPRINKQQVLIWCSLRFQKTSRRTIEEEDLNPELMIVFSKAADEVGRANKFENNGQGLQTRRNKQLKTSRLEQIQMDEKRRKKESERASLYIYM